MKCSGSVDGSSHRNRHRLSRRMSSSVPAHITLITTDNLDTRLISQQLYPEMAPTPIASRSDAERRFPELIYVTCRHRRRDKQLTRHKST